MSTLLRIVYDNRLYRKGLKTGWGFSCLVDHQGKRVLFDTGDNGQKLLFNLKALEVEPESIEAIVLSHNHWDHTGGLEAVIDKNKGVTVYFGDAFPETFKQSLREKGIRFSPISGMANISQGILVGPQMGGLGPKEIPLTLETNKGLVIITGCAHPGIARMVREVKESLKKKIYLVLGGFHLEFSLRVNKVISEFKRLGVEKAAPCHCTGNRAIALFEKSFGEDFIKVGAGLEIKVD
jgi:7,8-dihydropterin-6-yl-methyl-4-(beta-D-ribofuranosyl)aminobenzene 5'-phosphate synthase